MPAETDSMWTSVTAGSYSIDRFLDPATRMLRRHGTVDITDEDDGALFIVAGSSKLLITVAPLKRGFRYKASSFYNDLHMFCDSWHKDAGAVSGAEALLTLLASRHWGGSGTPPLHWLVLGGLPYAR